MLIVSGNPTGIDWQDTKMSLRIEDHPTPITELKRLIRIHRAYQHAEMGDKYIELEEIEKALIEYKKAEQYYPENVELPYWSAIALVNVNRLDDALPIFESVFQRNPNLREMTPRLFNSGFLKDDKEILRKIMEQ
jgi:tetratricopeptide (TPR) repeat protein